MKLNNVVIAGGNSGIGEKLIQLLADTDARITLLSRKSPDEQTNTGISHYPWDVTEALPENLELPEQLDGLVYCPGTINLKPFPLLKDDDFLRDFQVNVMGAVKLVRKYIKALKAGRGSVVFFSSVAASTGFPFHASVAAAKSALEGLSLSLAAEYASAGVRFNTVSISLTDTALASGLLKTEKQRQSGEDRHPIKGLGDPGEVASWVMHLLSQDSRWMTGQVIHIDGGIGSLRTG